ncbi:MAG: hypothetical protein KDJ31_05385 [Candidatus Competibacteraceae bacterium]|nr:hypothetical protein [Candidatus Competibacteraceae bacterium]HRY15271.1 methyl-accepting chemotaxis protein [Candidatus Competibacteraceae bacterium]
MFGSLKISTRISLAISLLLISAILAVVVMAFFRFEELLFEAEKREAHETFELLTTEIAARSRTAETLSVLLANLPEVQQAMTDKNRPQLLAQLQSVYQTLAAHYGVSQFQFHTPPATSFLRLHKPEKFGDDLSAFRLAVVEVNSSGKTAKGLENGVAGLGIRGIAPIARQGQHLGSVEFGMAFDETLFEALKAEHGVQITLLIPEAQSFKALHATHGAGSLLSQAQLHAALKGEIVAQHAKFASQPVMVYAQAIKDYSGKPIGVLEILVNRSGYVAEMAYTRNLILGIVGVVLAVSAVIIAWITRSIRRPIGGEPAEMAVLTRRIAQGDLTVALSCTGKETGVYAAMGDMTRQLQEMVGKVSQTAHQVNAAAVEIAQSSVDLSQRTEEQASALEETASSMEELTSTVQHSAENAEQTRQLTWRAQQQAEQGGQVVQQMTAAVVDIDQSSREIARIISVVDEIAFQTNLLALNASIEAARAGEQGWGFAVVASEVRKLAQRNADAAKEVGNLITDSLGKVEIGSKLVEQAGQTLEDIILSVRKVSDIVAETAAASQQQASGIEQINQAILQMDQTTQQNAALVEETANASQSMGKQASHLLELMSFFKLDEELMIATTPVAAQVMEHEQPAPKVIQGSVVAIERHHARSRQNATKIHHAPARSRHFANPPAWAVGGEAWDSL